jgi:NAD(P)-dependent dehydrogenase (short-subunit alcohol dehydrogenase family)
MIDLNIRTPYHAALEAGRHMPDGGRVIVIGSPMAIVCHLPAAPLTP